MPNRLARSPAGRPRHQHGFTLLEVIVALTVTSVILLGGRLLLERVSGLAIATSESAEAIDGAMNGDALLRSLAGRLEIGTGSSHHFGGDERSVHFTTWCDTPMGWLERCDAVLAFEMDGRAPALVAHLTPLGVNADIGPRRLVLARGFRRGALRYLNDPAAGGRWFIRWGEAVTAPLAIGVILDGDTSIVRIGGRE